MNDPYLLELRNISYTYSGKTKPVFSNINFSVSPGEIVTIYGCNGCGKSTLLKIIAHRYTDYSGEIYLDGCQIQGSNIPYEKISYCSQKNEDAVCYTVYRELSNQGRVSDTEINHIVEYFHCKTLLKKRMSSLSGGQLQLVFLMKAFLKNDSNLILLDEPINNLDSARAMMLSNYIKDYIARYPYKSILIVTHCRMFPNTTAYTLQNGILQKIESTEICQSCFGPIDENGYYKIDEYSEFENDEKPGFLNWFKEWFLS